ncbi:hypothetical protein ACP3TJ_04800 [Desulforudis sp. 1088]|uniref:hypothetical protein n=1 Tax=unclassified Candidatus Desulforudis TaxID=2635950 RepID=UPI003CE4869D
MRRTPVLAVIGIIAGGCLFLGGYKAAAALSGPGSAQDPLVTKSFVEEYVNKLLGQQGGGGGWRIDNVAPGQTVEARGGTELIVRAGKATVSDPSRSGIADLTSGTNLAAGQAVTANHLLLVPKDGRGLKASTAVVVMYRGSVELK